MNEFREYTGDLSRSTEIEVKKHKNEAFQRKEKQEELQAEQESVVCLSLGDRPPKQINLRRSGHRSFAQNEPVDCPTFARTEEIQCANKPVDRPT